MINKLIYPLRAGIRSLILIFLIIVHLLVYALSLIFKKHTKERAFALRRSFVKMAVVVLGIRFEIKGSPIDEPALYTCNHRSFSDPIINSIFIDAFVIAKAEVADIPVLNKGAELTGVIYVKRENKKSRTATRDVMIETIRSGYNVLVYPEGTVNVNPQVMPYKKGTFLESAKNGFPVVPIALEYKDQSDLWYKANFVKQMFRQFGKARTYAKMEIGPAFRSEDGIELSEMVEKWTNDKIREMNIGWSNMFSYE